MWWGSRNFAKKVQICLVYIIFNNLAKPKNSGEEEGETPHAKGREIN